MVAKGFCSQWRTDTNITSQVAGGGFLRARGETSGPQPSLGPEPALGHLSELFLTDPVILSHNRAEQAVRKLRLILNAVV